VPAYSTEPGEELRLRSPCHVRACLLDECTDRA
jgi:hypothetical protein